MTVETHEVKRYADFTIRTLDVWHNVSCLLSCLRYIIISNVSKSLSMTKSVVDLGVKLRVDLVIYSSVLFC